jgi:hypothetical protein
MGEWFEPLEYYFATRWEQRTEPQRTLPRAVYEAMRSLGGEKLSVDLVHAVEYDDDRIAWVMVTGDDTTLFHFEPPDTVTMTFLGSLAGGVYSEAVTTGEKGLTFRGAFKHPRLPADQPLRITQEPVAQQIRYPGVRDALDRTVEMRKRFRQWSTEPLSPQSESSA